MKICSRSHASDLRRGRRTLGVRAAAPLLLAAIAAASGGCSSAVDRRADAWGGEGVQSPAAGAARNPGPSQAGSWELVFQSPGTLASAEGPEYSRRDSSLNPRGNEPMTALSAWPEAPRADLARARSVRVRDNDRTFIYYFPTGNRRGTTGGASSDLPRWWY